MKAPEPQLDGQPHQDGNRGPDEPVTAAAVWIVLARAYRSMESYIEHSIAVMGIGLSDFMILEALLHKGAMRISTVGEKVLLANASMTAACDRLEERGLLRRESDASDRRARTVALTESGRELIERLYKQHESELNLLMDPVCPSELVRLREGLKRIGLSAKAALEKSQASCAARRASPLSPDGHRPVDGHLH